MSVCLCVCVCVCVCVCMVSMFMLCSLMIATVVVNDNSHLYSNRKIRRVLLSSTSLFCCIKRVFGLKIFAVLNGIVDMSKNKSNA